MDYFVPHFCSWGDGPCPSNVQSGGELGARGVQRRAHAIGDLGLRLPAELVAGAADVEARTLDLAKARLSELGLEIVPVARLLQDRDQIQHARLRAGADVDRAADIRVLRRHEVRRDDIAHVDVVARLAAVTVDPGAPALHQPAAEDRDHASLAERVLARAVDVPIAQRDGAHAVQARVEVAVLLGAELARAIAGHRRGRGALGAGDRLDVAVDRAAGAGVHDPRDARLARRLEHVRGADDVDAGIPPGVGDRLAHVDLGGEMEDRFGTGLLDDLGDAVRLADVGTDELGAVAARVVEVRLAARREIVDDHHVVAAGDEGVDEVAADEAGSAGDERAHGLSVLRQPRRPLRDGARPPGATRAFGSPAVRGRRRARRRSAGRSFAPARRGRRARRGPRV